MPRDDAVVSALNGLIQGLVSNVRADQKATLLELRSFVEAQCARSSDHLHQMLGMDVCSNLVVVTLDRYVKPSFTQTAKTKAFLASLRRDVTTAFRFLIEAVHQGVPHDAPCPPLSWKECRVVSYALKHVLDTMRSDVLGTHVAADYCIVAQRLLGHDVYIGALSDDVIEDCLTLFTELCRAAHDTENTPTIAESLGHICWSVFRSRTLRSEAMEGFYASLCDVALLHHADPATLNVRTGSALLSAAAATLRHAGLDHLTMRVMYRRLVPVVCASWGYVRKDTWRLAAVSFFNAILGLHEDDPAASRALAAPLYHTVLSMLNTKDAVLSSVSVKDLVHPHCPALDPFLALAATTFHVVSAVSHAPPTHNNEDDAPDPKRGRVSSPRPTDEMLSRLQLWATKDLVDENIFMWLHAIARYAEGYPSDITPSESASLTSALVVMMQRRGPSQPEARMGLFTLSVVMQGVHASSDALAEVLAFAMSNVQKFFSPESPHACAVVTLLLEKAVDVPVPWGALRSGPVASGELWLRFLTAAVRGPSVPPGAATAILRTIPAMLAQDNCDVRQLTALVVAASDGGLRDVTQRLREAPPESPAAALRTVELILGVSHLVPYEYGDDGLYRVLCDAVVAASHGVARHLAFALTVFERHEAVWSSPQLMLRDPAMRFVKAVAGLTRSVVAEWTEETTTSVDTLRVAMALSARLAVALCSPAVRERCADPLLNVRSVVAFSLETIRKGELDTGMPCHRTMRLVEEASRWVLQVEDTEAHTKLLAALCAALERHSHGFLPVFLRIAVVALKMPGISRSVLARVGEACMALLPTLPCVAEVRNQMCRVIVLAASRMEPPDRGVEFGRHLLVLLRDRCHSVRSHAGECLTPFIASFDNPERVFVEAAEALAPSLLPRSSAEAKDRRTGLESSMCRTALCALSSVAQTSHHGVLRRCLLTFVKLAAAGGFQERPLLLATIRQMCTPRNVFVPCASFLVYEWLHDYSMSSFPYRVMGCDAIADGAPLLAGYVLFAGMMHRAAGRGPHGDDAVRAVAESHGVAVEDLSLHREYFAVVVGLSCLMSQSTDPHGAEIARQVFDEVQGLFGAALFSELLCQRSEDVLAVMAEHATGRLLTHCHPMGTHTSFLAAITSLTGLHPRLLTPDRCFSLLLHVYKTVRASPGVAAATDRVHTLHALVRHTATHAAASPLLVRATCHFLMCIAEDPALRSPALVALQEVLRLYIGVRVDVVGAVLPHILTPLLALLAKDNTEVTNPAAPLDGDGEGDIFGEVSGPSQVAAVITELVSCGALKQSVGGLETLSTQPQLRGANELVRRASQLGSFQNIASVGYVDRALARYRTGGGLEMLAAGLVRFTEHCEAAEREVAGTEDLLATVRGLVPHCVGDGGAVTRLQLAALNALRCLWRTAPDSPAMRGTEGSDAVGGDVAAVLAGLRQSVVRHVRSVCLFDADPVVLTAAVEFLRVAMHFHDDAGEEDGVASPLKGEKIDAARRAALRSKLSEYVSQGPQPPPPAHYDQWVQGTVAAMVPAVLGASDPLRHVTQMASLSSAVARPVFLYCLLSSLRRPTALRAELAVGLTAAMEDPCASPGVLRVVVEGMALLHSVHVDLVTVRGMKGCEGVGPEVKGIADVPAEVSQMVGLPIPAILIARAATRCGRSHTAMMFVEMSCDAPRLGVARPKGSRGVPTGYLMPIYRDVDNADFLYGLALGDTVEGRLTMLRHKGSNARLSLLLDATLQSGSSPNGYAESLATALEAQGLFHVLSSGGGAQTLTEARCYAAWRQCQWIHAESTPVENSTLHGCLHNALKSLASCSVVPFRAAVLAAQTIVASGFVAHRRVADQLSAFQMVVTVERAWRVMYPKSVRSTGPPTTRDMLSLRAPPRQSYPSREASDALFATLLKIAGRDDMLPQHYADVAAAAKKARCYSIALAALHHPSVAYPASTVLLAKTLWKAGENDFALDLLSNNKDPVSTFVVGKWKCEGKLDGLARVLDDVLGPATAALDTGKAHYQFAKYCDQLYSDLEAKLNTAEHQTFIDQIEEVGKTREEHKSEYQKVHNALSENKKRHVKRHLSYQEREHTRMCTELGQFQSDKRKYCLQAMQSYGRALSLGGMGPAKLVTATYRFVSIWLANSQERDVTALVRAAMPSLRPAQFLPLFPQLCSRIGSSSESKDKDFQAALQALITSIVRAHPHSTLFNVFALTNCYRYQPGDADIHQVDTAKMGEGRALLAEMGRAHSELRPIIAELEVLIEAYIELAFASLAKTKTKHTITPLLAKITNMAHTPVPTCDPHTPGATLDPIKSFDAGVELPGGLNLPKLIRVVARSGTIHKQLVKSRDDLRQDALVEQVFRLCNGLFTSNAETRRRGMRVRTYLVIPLTPTSGIVQWVENSETLGEYLTGTHESPELGAHYRYHPNDISTSDARAKLSAVSGRSVATKLSVFRSVCEGFTPSLHHFFLEKFRSPSEWFERRVAYTCSVAANSMVGHIVGLGDRHTSNILIDCRTGEIVNIDIGLAFDEGMLLPVPERIPFRLTRDIVDGMGVTGMEGVFRKGCEASMGVLRASRDMLQTVLDALLHDPLARWAVDVTKALGGGGGAHQNQNNKKKASGHAVLDAQRASARVQEKLNGVLANEALAVPAQVQMLIQQATNEETLAQLFPGWAPWV